MNRRTLFLWSLRREIWENRALYLAPFIIASLAMLGFILGISSGKVIPLHPDARVLPHGGAIAYSMAASIILVTGWIVGIMYAADALHGDRRDRSILFWKSMPVSDRLTVLSKATMPLVVIPAVACAAAIVTQLAMLLLSTAVLAAVGGDPASPWQTWPMAQQTLVMLYGVAIHALWFAPIYAWLLLVSAWARRSVLIWAFMPLLGLFALEKVALGSSWLMSAINYRIVGAMTEGFSRGALNRTVTQLSQLDPVRFFSNPNLWLGLAFAGLCLALAVRLRRYAEPL
jgi:ABC-2 type transport system permease protein